MKIDVQTYVQGTNGVEYAEYLGRTLRKYQSGKHNITLKAFRGINTDCPDGWSSSGTFAVTTTQSSLQHGYALMECMSKFDTDAEIAVIIDADTAVLYPGWDDVVSNECNDSNQVWGWEFPNEMRRGARGYPGIFFLSIHRSAGLNWNFVPVLDDRGERCVKHIFKKTENRCLYGRNSVKCDTGWMIGLTCKEHRYSARALPFVPRDSDMAMLSNMPFEKHHRLHQGEWHYQGRLFGTHKQAARSHPINGKYGKQWTDRIEVYESTI